MNKQNNLARRIRNNIGPIGASVFLAATLGVMYLGGKKALEMEQAPVVPCVLPEGSLLLSQRPYDRGSYQDWVVFYTEIGNVHQLRAGICNYKTGYVWGVSFDEDDIVPAVNQVESVGCNVVDVEAVRDTTPRFVLSSNSISEVLVTCGGIESR